MVHSPNSDLRCQIFVYTLIKSAELIGYRQIEYKGSVLAENPLLALLVSLHKVAVAFPAGGEAMVLGARSDVTPVCCMRV